MGYYSDVSFLIRKDEFEKFKKEYDNKCKELESFNLFEDFKPETFLALSDNEYVLCKWNYIKWQPKDCIEIFEDILFSGKYKTYEFIIIGEDLEDIRERYGEECEYILYVNRETVCDCDVVFYEV